MADLAIPTELLKLVGNDTKGRQTVVGNPRIAADVILGFEKDIDRNQGWGGKQKLQITTTEARC